MENQETLPTIKVVVVGDAIGKTFLLNAYVYDKLPDYSFSLFQHYTRTINVDNKNYQVEMHDTPGQEDYEKLRPLSYPNTNCFILCFSISGRNSYENITSRWVPEIKQHMPNTPIILVATQSDSRENSEIETVTKAEGKRLRCQIKAASYIECSAVKRINLHKVFEEAVRCSIKKSSKSSKSCILM